MAFVAISKNMSIQEMIDSMHDPSLIIPTEQPNGNRIYHLYSDGEITNQKGGWAYLKRGEFTDKFSISGNYRKYIFPINNGNVSYAILTQSNAYQIRSAMISETV